MLDAKMCSPGYKLDRKTGRCVFLKDVGFNSHGRWSTLGGLESVERERGNPFPRTGYAKGTPAIWITFDRKDALRYAVSSGDWDRIAGGGALTREERDMLRYDIVSIPLKRTDRIILDDGDGGYLLVRPR